MTALLFDLDGTMLNSDAIHEEIFLDLMTSRRVEVTDGFYMKHIHGRLNVDIFAEFLPDEPDPQGLSEWKEAQFRDRLPRPFPGMPGVVDVLQSAQTKGWPVVVVTNAMRLNAEAMLTAIGARNYVEDLVIGEECANAKPHPEPYQIAMQRVDHAPEDCIAFEDSPTGIRAAAASGAFTIGVRSALSDADLRHHGAYATIQDFTDPALPALLERFTGAAA